ncbi:type II toxin-antitoxin system ParD family antitoxin [Neorhizobium sp. SOG26]|uniref:ribbon-helix-helix domain-containing protein n=1 Tax=Neorhizobium sp. SOG26 TaxID=2060726 RepID=UPI000E56B4D1|nr:type II toxin-antitoxin system ParD family antitoxin [Neorhizobium sp. SOG26]AXV16213.1 type II toxin-antitoxin system ParD family antitoxin [Neorhizobium sp. SOG26]
MADITVSDTVKDLIEDRVRAGEYASAGDYVRDLVLRERSRQGDELSIEELKEIVAAGRASGVSPHSVHDIFERAKKRFDASQKAGG